MARSESPDRGSPVATAGPGRGGQAKVLGLSTAREWLPADTEVSQQLRVASGYVRAARPLSTQDTYVARARRGAASLAPAARVRSQLSVAGWRSCQAEVVRAAVTIRCGSLAMAQSAERWDPAGRYRMHVVVGKYVSHGGRPSIEDSRSYGLPLLESGARPFVEGADGPY
jgi:hypothetical protein